jgi:hypothetical protein
MKLRKKRRLIKKIFFHHNYKPLYNSQNTKMENKHSENLWSELDYSIKKEKKIWFLKYFRSPDLFDLLRITKNFFCNSQNEL